MGSDNLVMKHSLERFMVCAERRDVSEPTGSYFELATLGFMQDEAVGGSHRERFAAITLVNLSLCDDQRVSWETNSKARLEEQNHPPHQGTRQAATRKNGMSRACPIGQVREGF